MLKGKRVQLRLIERNDMPVVVEWRNLNYKYFYDGPFTLEKQNEWFDNYLKSGDLLFIIEDKSWTQGLRKKKLGMIGLSKIDHKNRHAEFGRFLILRNSRRKGYGKEALELMLIHGFDYLNLNKIYLDTFEENKRAIQLYEWVGFKTIGIKKEHIFREGYHDLRIMEIKREDFKWPKK